VLGLREGRQMMLKPAVDVREGEIAELYR